MNYSALIQNRKSVREFADKPVSAAALAEIETYYQKSCQRLVPELETKLCVFGQEAREALEGAAGYESFLIGAPNYLVLLSTKGELAGENAGYMMEDLVLKLTDMDLGCCWITFTDSEKVKAALKIDSPLDVAAIVAFGQGVKTTKRLRVNILSMSNVDVSTSPPSTVSTTWCSWTPGATLRALTSILASMTTCCGRPCTPPPSPPAT